MSLPLQRSCNDIDLGSLGQKIATNCNGRLILEAGGNLTIILTFDLSVYSLIKRQYKNQEICGKYIFVDTSYLFQRN